ncbi:MAG: hypothetical protein ACXWXA_11440 [Candidatus Limnocylindrales bacterium]
MTDPVAPAANGYDPTAAVDEIMRWLERWGWDAIPHGPIPPADPTSLLAARTQAESAATASGRSAALRDLRRSIVDWALGQYRLAGLGAVYFSGALEPPEQRREGIEVLIDAATANLLGDVLPEETSSTLLGRLDVWRGGPIFRIAREDA